MIDDSGTAQFPDGIFDVGAAILTREYEPGDTLRPTLRFSHSA